MPRPLVAVTIATLLAAAGLTTAAASSVDVTWTGEGAGPVPRQASWGSSATRDVAPTTKVTVTKDPSGSGTGTISWSTGADNCTDTCTRSFTALTSLTITATGDSTTATIVNGTGGCSAAEANPTASCTFTTPSHGNTATLTVKFGQ